MKKQKFKVGDNCKVVKRLHNHEFEIGEKVTISKCFPDGKPPHYECINGTRFWFLSDEELELLK
jgi:hypothetical protein